MATKLSQPGPEMPTVLTIPASILSNGVISQTDCKLLNLTNEVLLCVLKTPNLDVFDKACLALTCKRFGNLVYGFERELKPLGELKSGEEEELLDLNVEASFDDEEAQLEERLVLIRRFKGRVDTQRLASFFQRLDDGWSRNKADSRFCYSCGIFRNTTKAYWDIRVRKYETNSLSLAASKWRRMKDCYCGCGPQQLVDAWTEYGRREKQVIPSDSTSSRENTGFWYTQCPDCMLSIGGHASCRCGCCGGICGCGCC